MFLLTYIVINILLFQLVFLIVSAVLKSKAHPSIIYQLSLPLTDHYPFQQSGGQRPSYFLSCSLFTYFSPFWSRVRRTCAQSICAEHLRTDENENYYRQCIFDRRLVFLPFDMFCTRIILSFFFCNRRP